DLAFSLDRGKLVLQLPAFAVLHLQHVEEERVVGAMWSGIIHGNAADDAVERANKHRRNALDHHRRAIFANDNGVAVVGDAPAAREGGGRYQKQKEQCDHPPAGRAAGQREHRGAQNLTATGSRSVALVSSKNCRGVKPNMPATTLLGKLAIFVLRSRTTAL